MHIGPPGGEGPPFNGVAPARSEATRTNRQRQRKSGTQAAGRKESTMGYHHCPIEPSDWSDGPDYPPECPECCGEGKVDEDAGQVCDVCGGLGYLEPERFDDDVI